MADSTVLYTPQVLALAAGLSEWPLDPGASLIGEARSRSCGSEIRLSLGIDAAGAISQLGIAARACAVGQAAAAVFAGAAMGRDSGGIGKSLHEIERWLRDGAPLPDWPGLDAIARARDFPGRHNAILLAWQAALQALPSAGSTR